MREYSENFLQLVNNHRPSNSPKAKAKEYKSWPKHKHVKMSQPAENRSNLNQIDPFPVLASVSPVKQPDNPPRTKNAHHTQPKSEAISKVKQPSKKQGSFEDYTAMKTPRVEKKRNNEVADYKDINQEDNEDIDISDNSVMSIQRFRSLISSLAGGDGSGFPEIEAVLARQPAWEEEVRQAAREYWGSC